MEPNVRDSAARGSAVAVDAGFVISDRVSLMPVTAWVAWRDHQALSSSRSRLLPPRSLPGARGDRFGTLWSEQVVHPLGSGPAERGAHVRVRAERQADLAMASVSMTTRVATPWVRRSVAQAWRRSWNRWWGSPAVFSSVWNRRV